MTDLCSLDIDGPIATLTLNRPEQRNALSLELIECMRAKVREIGDRDDLSVVVLSGQGRAFCAGMDLKQVLAGKDLPLRLLESLARLTLEIRSLPMIVVASVNGAAIGGGCGLVCVCDIALTHDEARLGFPEVDLGLCPAVVAPWVVQRIGPARARSVLLQGGLMSGCDAARINLVGESVPTREDLEAATVETADRLAQGGREAIRATKSLLNRFEEYISEEILLEGAALSAHVLAQPEAQQALRARYERA